MTPYCCETMEFQLKQTCSTGIHDKYECPDQVIHRWADGRTGIHIKDGGSSMLVMKFCPWCGTDIAIPEPDDTDGSDL